MIKSARTEHPSTHPMMLSPATSSTHVQLAATSGVAPSRDTMPSSIPRSREVSERDVRLRGLVDLYFDFIWRSLRGFGVPAASADDATQQVFWIASQKMESIVVGSERAFLFTIARGIAANARRGQSRNREVANEVAIAVQRDASPNPEQVAASNEAKKLLEQFLEMLPDDLRTVFMLFELEGLTIAEIADACALPMGTVGSKLRRAREEFQETIRRFQARRGGKS